MRRFFFYGTILGMLFFAPLVNAETLEQRQASLQAQLEQIEKEITANKGQLEEQSKQRATLERDVAILNGRVRAAQLELKQRDLTLSQIQENIVDSEHGMRDLDQQVASGEASVAAMIRETRAIDDLSLIEIALNGNFQELMQEVDDFQAIQVALRREFTRLNTVRLDLSAKKRQLEEKQQEEQELRQLQALQQKALRQTEKEKQDLVVAARGQESIYQQVIATKQESAGQIRAALFGLRDATGSVTFGDIMKYAKEASVKTGVRPALILGILAEESNLGENIGKGTWRLDMHPTRDAPIFLEIMRELGLDPDKTPVSKKPWYGWGGAMGPAQFIPSTWQLYKARIGKLAGQEPPNPFDARTAVFAAALLMMDNGADAQTRASERLAALRYLAGWKNASKPAYAFYGNEVMQLADKYQKQIDILGG